MYREALMHAIKRRVKYYSVPSQPQLTRFMEFPFLRSACLYERAISERRASYQLMERCIIRGFVYAQWTFHGDSTYLRMKIFSRQRSEYVTNWNFEENFHTVSNYCEPVAHQAYCHFLYESVSHLKNANHTVSENIVDFTTWMEYFITKFNTQLKYSHYNHLKQKKFSAIF